MQFNGDPLLARLTPRDDVSAGPSTTLEPQQLADLFEGAAVDAAYFDALVSAKHGASMIEKLCQCLRDERARTETNATATAASTCAA